VCGVDDATSSPKRRSRGPFSHAIAVLSFDQAQTKPKIPYLARQMSKEISSRVAERTHQILALIKGRMNTRKTRGFRVVRAAGA
jgi:TolB-like protein